MWWGEKGGADAFAAARPLCGVKGSDGCKPSVPEAVVVDRHCHVLRLAKRPEVERKC